MKAGQTGIPRSKTSDDIPTTEASALAPPTVVARTHSVENLSTGKTSPQNPKPVPMPRRDSVGEKDANIESRPKPAPRRNVQSCFVSADSMPAQASASQRPLSMANRGNLPPLPKSHPETSQNYYASVVDTSTLDPKMASMLLNSKDIEEVASADTQEQSVSDRQCTEYETLWGGAPAVPKRKDVSEESGSTLLDKPVSPQEVKPDPFDTSSVTQMLPTSVPILPTVNPFETQNGPSSSATPSDPVLPSVPPRPKPDSQLMAEFDSLNDFGSGNNQAPPSRPPPSPPIADNPVLPPPPPRRTDLSMCNNEPIDTVLAFPSEVKGPPVAVRRNVGGEPVLAPPPVPARPAVPVDIDVTSQQIAFGEGVSVQPALGETPPIPARPAPPPPVPKRPVN